MNSIGIMTLTWKSEQTYFLEIAKNAHLYGLECYCFIPSSISPTTELIHGLQFDPKQNKWKKSTFPIPTIIYDRCFYGDDPHSKQCISIVNWLKNRQDLVFLGYGLPNKMELYHSLSSTGLFAYLPPSQSINNAEEVMEVISRTSPIILKPTNGSQGFGIYYLENQGSTIMIKTEKKGKPLIEVVLERKQAIHFLNNLFRTRSYLIQPYLPLKDEEECPFDIRALLQKDENGNWIVRGKGIRRGQTSGILSNLSTGAEVIPFDVWFTDYPKTFTNYIANELADIYKRLPQILEQHFPPLFELGIDIGMTKEGALWILDINSKPGRKVIVATTPVIQDQLMLAPLQYAQYLRTHMEKGEHIHASSLLY